MLRQRILSALVLAPIALAAVWVGNWAFVALACVAGVLLGWEWGRLCFGRFDRAGMLLSILGFLTAVSGHVFPSVGITIILIAAVIGPLVYRPIGRSPWWMIGGAFYIGLPALSLVWIRDLGQLTLLWLLLLVWATDIGAYAAGRMIGGPKLLPKVSPKKTWAGLIGGILSAALVGTLISLSSKGNAPHPVVLAMISGLLAIVAQAGDLGESWVKRHFGVKDSSTIIPGHGGVLDRLDGLLATAPVVAAVCLIFSGGLSQWQ